MRLTKQKQLPRYLNNVKFLKPDTKHKNIIQIIGKQKNISKDKSRPIEYLLISDQNEVINIWNKKYKDKSVQWYVAGKDDVLNKYFGNLLLKVKKNLKKPMLKNPMRLTQDNFRRWAYLNLLNIKDSEEITQDSEFVNKFLKDFYIPESWESDPWLFYLIITTLRDWSIKWQTYIDTHKISKLKFKETWRNFIFTVSIPKDHYIELFWRDINTRNLDASKYTDMYRIAKVKNN